MEVQRPGEPAEPVVQRLTDGERRRVWLATALPALLVAVAWAVTGQDLSSTVVATVLYGGLAGATVGLVVHERAAAGHCPGCNAAGPPGRDRCEQCGYDLAARPRYLCPERHRLYLEPGLCACGQRLQQLAPPRGVGREIRRILWAGVWLAVFLVGAVVLLEVTA